MKDGKLIKQSLNKEFNDDHHKGDKKPINSQCIGNVSLLVEEVMKEQSFRMQIKPEILKLFNDIEKRTREEERKNKIIVSGDNILKLTKQAKAEGFKEGYNKAIERIENMSAVVDEGFHKLVLVRRIYEKEWKAIKEADG